MDTIGRRQKTVISLNRTMIILNRTVIILDLTVIILNLNVFDYPWRNLYTVSASPLGTSLPAITTVGKPSRLGQHQSGRLENSCNLQKVRDKIHIYTVFVIWRLSSFPNYCRHQLIVTTSGIYKLQYW